MAQRHVMASLLANVLVVTIFCVWFCHHHRFLPFLFIGYEVGEEVVPTPSTNMWGQRLVNNLWKFFGLLSLCNFMALSGGWLQQRGRHYLWASFSLFFCSFIFNKVLLNVMCWLSRGAFRLPCESEICATQCIFGERQYLCGLWCVSFKINFCWW